MQDFESDLSDSNKSEKIVGEIVDALRTLGCDGPLLLASALDHKQRELLARSIKQVDDTELAREGRRIIAGNQELDLTVDLVNEFVRFQSEQRSMFADIDKRRIAGALQEFRRCASVRYALEIDGKLRECVISTPLVKHKRRFAFTPVGGGRDLARRLDLPANLICEQQYPSP